MTPRRSAAPYGQRAYARMPGLGLAPGGVLRFEEWDRGHGEDGAMGRLVAVCTLILGICLAALPAGAAQRVALVIGNSDYKLISPLANPENDAALMAETLRGVGFEVIEAKNADRRGMARAIRDFGKRLRRAGPAGERFAFDEMGGAPG